MKGIEILPLLLRVQSPEGGVIHQQRDLRLRCFYHRQFRQISRNFSDLVAGAIRRVVRPVEGCVHLLLRKGRLTPTEIAHYLRPVRKGLVGPKPHHAGMRIWIP